MNEPQKKVTIGQIVLYTYQKEDLPSGKQYLVGEVRPAIVVRIWPNEYPQQGEDGYNLQVFSDSANDGLSGIIWKPSVRLASEVIPGTCHCLPRI